MGKGPASPLPESVKQSRLVYECQPTGEHLVVVDGPDEPQAWLLPASHDVSGFDLRRAKTGTPFTHHFRDAQADHYLTWEGDPPRLAIDTVVPRDRTLDASRIAYTEPDAKLTLQAGRVVGFEGRSRPWPCRRHRDEGDE